MSRVDEQMNLDEEMEFYLRRGNKLFFRARDRKRRFNVTTLNDKGMPLASYLRLHQWYHVRLTESYKGQGE